MSACHLDTKQVTPPCFEMFPLTSPQIKFSGGGGVVDPYKMTLIVNR